MINLISLLIIAIRYFCNFLYALILIRVLLSWFPIPRNNKLIQLLYALTEPLLAPIRNIIRKSPLGGPGMVLDFSPIIAYFLITLLQQLLTALLLQFI